MSDGLVPIGTVIDWWRDSEASVVLPFPDGYQICDGSEIRQGPLAGQKTPNLQHVFIRGAVTVEELGDTGGMEKAPLPKSTGSCYNDGDDPGRAAYLVRDDHQKWGSDVHLRVDEGNSKDEGQHRHDLGGTVSIVPPYYSLLKLMRIS